MSGNEALDAEIARIDQGGSAWQETDAVVDVQVKRPMDRVVPVRLSADTWDLLRKEAHELGIGPSTLIRMWVLERLRQARGAQTVA